MSADKDCYSIPIEDIINRVAYYGDSPELNTAITLTLHNMPREIALFAAERCSFISIGKVAMGMVLPGRIGVHHNDRRSRNMWIIVLDKNIPDKDLHGAIAHEVANAWLGHDRIGEMSENCEIQAANLAMEWGFTGKGADAKLCEEQFRHRPQ